MKIIKIKFDLIKSVQEFCNLITNIDADVIISSGVYIVNGKILLGIMSLNLNNVLSLKINGSTEDENRVIDICKEIGIYISDAGEC